MKVPFYSLSLQCLFDSYYFFLSLSLFALRILSSWLLFVSNMGSLCSPFSLESEFCGSLLLGLFRVFGILQKASESQKIHYIICLTSSYSHNSFMTVKQVLFLILSKKVKIYYSITAKNFHFIMAY
ncbi:MAG: hypothetical protein K0S67_1825 [Nitrososphaeraceae archaeon]|nr:hypothetical protein [Nitrososphaeraceae archaeon]